MNAQDPFDRFLDVSTLELEGDFDAQVQQLLSAVRLTRSEVENLDELIADLTATFSKKWPSCKVYPFGSIVMGLGIRSSDIDCYVTLPEWAQNNHKTVYIARQLLVSEPFKYAEISCIPRAKVPIVKFYHLPTDRNCDANFKSFAGVQNSRLLAYLLHVDPRALPLAILVKYWSKVHYLTGTNLVPNYAMTLMIVFYLQHVSILPPVHLLQQGTEEMIVDNWNTAFSKIEFQNHDNITVYQLLGGFFEFYANFNFEAQVVCPFLGCAIDKDCFADASRMPKEFALYKLQNNVFETDKAICVQDPFEHSRNCGVAVSVKLKMRLCSLFAMAAEMFYTKSPEDYLTSIMTRSIPVVEEKKPENKDKKFKNPKFTERRTLNRLPKHPNKVEKWKEQNAVNRKITKNIHTLFNQYKHRRHH